MTTYPVTEAQQVRLHLALTPKAAHLFEVPDIFADFDSGDTDPKASADCYPQQRLYRTRPRWRSIRGTCWKTGICSG